MDKKTLIKRVTKIKGGDTEVYTKTFFTNCILKNNPVKTAFYTTIKNLKGECKNNGRHKRSCWTLIIFSSNLTNFEHFAQTSTIAKLFIKVKLSLVQSLVFKVQSSQLSTINSNPLLRMWFHRFDTLLSYFGFNRLP